MARCTVTTLLMLTETTLCRLASLTAPILTIGTLSRLKACSLALSTLKEETTIVLVPCPIGTEEKKLCSRLVPVSWHDSKLHFRDVSMEHMFLVSRESN